MASLQVFIPNSSLDVFIDDVRAFFLSMCFTPSYPQDPTLSDAEMDPGMLRNILDGEDFMPFEDNMRRIFSPVKLTSFTLDYLKYGVFYSNGCWPLCSFEDLFKDPSYCWEDFVKSVNEHRHERLRWPQLREINCNCCQVKHSPISTTECFFGTPVYVGPIPALWGHS